MATFKPSPSSLTPRAGALLTLKYVRKAVDELEEILKEREDVPAWALTKINQGATCLGAALRFMSFKSKDKKDTKS